MPNKNDNRVLARRNAGYLDAEAVKLLQQNLKDEQATWKKMEGFSKKIKPEQMGMEEEGEEEPSRSRGRSRRAA